MARRYTSDLTWNDVTPKEMYLKPPPDHGRCGCDAGGPA